MTSINYNKRFIIGITLVSAMGGLLFGYDWVVIGGAKPFYERFFDITQSASLQGWAMSSALIGCLFGALFSGYLSDRFGRKLPLIFAAALFTISAIGTGAVGHFTPFIVFRLLGGLAIGIASATSPMYIAEVSPAPCRGRSVAVNQLTIVIGILGLAILMLVVLAIAVYALTLAPVTWVVLSEIFPNRIRGAAMAVATTSLWLASFGLTYTFPLLNKWLNASGTFWLYALICIAGLVFIYKRLPETKGKSLEEIEKSL